MRLRGRPLLVAAACLWSLSGTFVKFIDLHPIMIVFSRSLCASACLMPFLHGRMRRPHPLSIVAILAYSGMMTSFVSATKITSAANAVLLLYTAPLYVFLLSTLVLREPPDRANIMTLVIGMMGVAVIFFGRSGERDSLGIAFGAASGLLFAIYTVILRRLRDFDPLFLTVLHNLGVAFVLSWFVAPHVHPSREQVIILIVMGVVQLALPSAFYTAALRTVPAPEASTIILIEPVLNATFVAFFIGEHPSLATIAGGLLIVGGLAARYFGRPIIAS